MRFALPGQAVIGLVLLALLMPARLVGAQQPSFAVPAIEAVWSRADGPVAAGAVNRTWLWGPGPFTGALEEPYAQSPGGQRLVQYFDKSRMEVNDPDQPTVTTGLLSKELITGRLQTGDASFEERAPAPLPVAGDPDDATGPHYATFRELLSAPARNVSEPIVETLTRTGARASQPDLGRYGVTAAYLVPETQHVIASPFWDFLGTTGPVSVDGQLQTAPLFEPTFFVTGLPITEAYWTRVKVGGQPQDVLVQAFERRVLTYTPSNPEGFQVEMGNVGRHYHTWRYASTNQPPRQPQPALASDFLLQLSDLPAGYRIQEEKSEDDGLSYTRTFVDPNRVLSGFPFVGSVAGFMPDAETARQAIAALPEAVKADGKGTTETLTGVGETALIYTLDTATDGLTMRVTMVAFNRGRVLGVVVGTALPQLSDQAQLIAWAKVMDGRIQRAAPPPPAPLPPADNGQAAPQDGVCPAGFPVKGHTSKREKIYHVPGGAYYERTKPEVCFRDEAAAQAAGYRRADA